MLAWLRKQNWLRKHKFIHSTYQILRSGFSRAKVIANWPKRQRIIRSTYESLGLKLSRSKAIALDKGLPVFNKQSELVFSIMLLKEGFDSLSESAIELHLLFIHNARLKMIKHLLPPAKNILDLGGANAPLHHMGYPHDYSKIVMIDLPTQERHKDFQVQLDDGDGKIFIRYENMTDLQGIASDSIDFVWSGQSIEHVSLEHGKQMCEEAFRVLEPGGYFCLDTPNRLVTQLHTAPMGGGFIHPDHKLEYTPDQLRALLISAGFTIMQEWGICEMPLTTKNQSFTYQDFIIGGSITKNINDSYIQFFACIKPLV